MVFTVVFWHKSGHAVSLVSAVLVNQLFQPLDILRLEKIKRGSHRRLPKPKFPSCRQEPFGFPLEARGHLDAWDMLVIVDHDDIIFIGSDEMVGKFLLQYHENRVKITNMTLKFAESIVMHRKADSHGQGALQILDPDLAPQRNIGVELVAIQTGSPGSGESDQGISSPFMLVDHKHTLRVFFDFFVRLELTALFPESDLFQHTWVALRRCTDALGELR